MVKTKEAVALIERIKELLAEKKAENVVALDLRRVSEGIQNRFFLRSGHVCDALRL